MVRPRAAVRPFRVQLDDLRTTPVKGLLRLAEANGSGQMDPGGGAWRPARDTVSSDPLPSRTIGPSYFMRMIPREAAVASSGSTTTCRSRDTSFGTERFQGLVTSSPGSGNAFRPYAYQRVDRDTGRELKNNGQTVSDRVRAAHECR